MDNPFELSPLTKQAIEFYERELKDKLEPEHIGKGLAIHPETGDYVIDAHPSKAGLALAKQHTGGIVTMRIGPPTVGDIMLAERMLASKMR